MLLRRPTKSEPTGGNSGLKEKKWNFTLCRYYAVSKCFLFSFQSTMASAQVTESPICRELYDHQNLFPRLLSCGRTFCSSCLENLLKNNSISCPDCRKTGSILTGVAGLTSWSLRYLKRKFFRTNPLFCCF